MAHEGSPALEGDAGRSDRSAGAAHKLWQPYLDATLGFRNHWYPACFGSQLAEGECRGQEMLSERLLFKRIDGKVYAIEDRCAHRGVQLSRRPECHTKNTISCWYHGFTYDLRNGRLVAIITDPESPLVGTLAVKSYPVEERKGLVFAFIGDEQPHALALDLQPGFLDDDLAIYANGDHELIKSNWRLAAENGVDASHIYIHRNSGLVNAARKQLPLASFFLTREGTVVDQEGAPKGVVKGAGRKTSVWETEIEGVKIESQYRPSADATRSHVTNTSLWLPCGLKVEPFPLDDTVQFEWYTPCDAHSHHYIVTWGRRVKSAAETAMFVREMDAVWKDMVVNNFNNEDVIAREAMERFYAEEDGWNREYLYRPDIVITEWRKLASKHNRGIQKRPGAPPQT
jgi:carbazole 1,9a-dioxygenase terminal dioxygenase component